MKYSVSSFCRYTAMNSSSRAVRYKVSAQLTSVSFLALTPYSADTGTEIRRRQEEMGEETDRQTWGGDRRRQTDMKEETGRDRNTEKADQ